MKHGFSALVCLNLTLCLTLSACGYSLNSNKAIITSPGGGGTGPGPSEKTMPEPATNDHFLFAMQELIRVYHSSEVLLTAQDKEDSDLGCIHYKRSNDDKPRKDGSLVFRSATYTNCGWEQLFGAQRFNWSISARDKGGEIFAVSIKELTAEASLTITATPIGTNLIEADKPKSKLGLGNLYFRKVSITRASDTQTGRAPFKAHSWIGKENEPRKDFWRTHFKGDWLIDSGKIKGEIRDMVLRYDQAKTSDHSQPQHKILSFHSEGPIRFMSGTCPRPLGQFRWENTDSEGNLIADSGQFEAKEDGLHASSGEFIAWPKSCLEFPAPTFD